MEYPLDSPPKFRTLTLKVRVTPEEHAALKAICTDERIGYPALFEAFIADATRSRRSRGPDFDWWFERREFGHPCLSCHGKGETPAGDEIARRSRWLWLWREKARRESGSRS